MGGHLKLWLMITWFYFSFLCVFKVSLPNFAAHFLSCRCCSGEWNKWHFGVLMLTHMQGILSLLKGMYCTLDHMRHTLKICLLWLLVWFFFFKSCSVKKNFKGSIFNRKRKKMQVLIALTEFLSGSLWE